MFGSKARREERKRRLVEQVANELREQQEREASYRPNLMDATSEVLRSTTPITLRSCGAKIVGDVNGCYIQPRSDEGLNPDYQLNSVKTAYEELTKVLSASYSYVIQLKASYPSIATQLRGTLGDFDHSHRDESRPVFRSFSSIKNLEEWLQGEGRQSSDRVYSISITK